MRLAILICALPANGCLMMATGSSEPPRMESWDVAERVGLPESQSARSTKPTRVVVVPEQTALTELDTRRTLCSGAAPCQLSLAPGRRRVGLYDDPSSVKPTAEFWLDVDERPMVVEVERPKVGLAYAGAGLAVAGLIGVVIGGLGTEIGDDDDTSNTILIGGIGMIVIGFGLGGIYWASGRGDVVAKPLRQ